MRSEPVVVVDAEQEETVERVAAVDVAKATGRVCTRLPDPGRRGKRVTRVWEVPATTNAIIELGDQLMVEGVERVVVESTSDYWRPFVYLLGAAGLRVWLVNAREVKNVPGRPKTDTIDAVWLAKLNERGMLRPSFVPPAQIRQLRDYTRLRSDLVAERSRHKQRLEKLLEDALIKLSTVASDIFGVSGRVMLEALIAGRRDPRQLADLARGKLRVKQAALVEALTGRFDDHHAEIARMLLDQVDSLDAQIDRITARIDQLLTDIPEPVDPTTSGQDSGEGGGEGSGEGRGGSAPCEASRYYPPAQRLAEIPGIGPKAAQVIIAEIGLDMRQFPTAKHLASWAKLSPRTIQSGPRNRSGQTGKGNPYLKSVLGEAAAAASRTDTFLGERYRRLVKRRGKLKALVAVARSILVIIWQLLANPHARYHDLGRDYHNTRIDKNRKVRTHLRQLQALGYHVTLTTT
ncbi:IS110 family transposase [Kribbella sp. NBC_01510]|uniref:IS110 family transposase n=1 Tax=Kribbella sp. NBC_01510 TaxID=2903581 RepID=UPI0038690E95